ncbi:MAG TPA: hypothetical protein VKY22_10045 [Bradyrhizobium sp.]|nr:hypothetical protein [Bradyrhizobium sp.]
MTMLSHDLERRPDSSADRQPRRTGLTQSQRSILEITRLKSFALGALTLLLSGAALAAVIALRMAVYVSRLHLGTG